MLNFMSNYSSELAVIFPIYVDLSYRQTDEVVRILIDRRRGDAPASAAFAVSCSKDPARRDVWLSLFAAKFLKSCERTPVQVAEAVTQELDSLDRARKQRLRGMASGY